MKEKKNTKECMRARTLSEHKSAVVQWLMSFKHGQQIKQVATDEYNGLRTARHRHDYCYIEGNTSTNYHPADPFRGEREGPPPSHRCRNIAQLQHVLIVRVYVCVCVQVLFRRS